MDSRRYFEEVAKQWDDMRREFFSDTVRDVALSAASVYAGAVAADIGAGTGYITEGLVEKRVRVIAVDWSEAMLRQMREKFSTCDMIDYRLGQAELLPLDDQQVDFVFANMYLHHVPAPLEAIKEMVRVLKPGGKLVITDLDKHDFTFLKSEHYDYWLGFERNQVQKWFEQAGLSNVRIGCVGSNCVVSNCGNEAANISIFVATGLKPAEHVLTNDVL